MAHRGFRPRAQPRRQSRAWEQWVEVRRPNPYIEQVGVEDLDKWKRLWRMEDDAEEEDNE